MPALARRRYRFDAATRREYPAAKAFLAPQRTGERAALKLVPRDELPIRQGVSHVDDQSAVEPRMREAVRSLRQRLLRRRTAA